MEGPFSIPADVLVAPHVYLLYVCCMFVVFLLCVGCMLFVCVSCVFVVYLLHAGRVLVMS